MMAFKISVCGQNVLMMTDNDEVCCGFVKNEYVWARTEQEAITRAKNKVLAKLVKNPAIHLNAAAFNLEVDEIEAGVAWWKPMTNESFIFYRREQDSLS